MLKLEVFFCFVFLFTDTVVRGMLFHKLTTPEA